MGRKSYKDQQEVMENSCESVITPAEEFKVKSEDVGGSSMEVLDELLQASDKERGSEQETPNESEELIPTQEGVKPENTKINLNTSKGMEKVKKEEVELEIEIPENSDKIVGIPKRSALYKKLNGGAGRTH